ncbi:MAG: hypothetical protein H6577_25510 [Lewinellaceae bacterium]|nr:hypothetical protein [Lewinellaceae bacterium]
MTSTTTASFPRPTRWCNAKLTAPAWTPTATITGSVNIPTSALSGPTRMRVSMKRGAYATACETLPFGEVEDYTVNISTGPAQLPNLSINSVEVVPGWWHLFHQPRADLPGVQRAVAQQRPGSGGPFTIKGWWSKDQQLSANDLLWQTFQFSGVAANDVVYWNFSNSVPTSLAPGIHYVIIRMDSENTVTESNESDNERVVGVFIGAPDFTVSNVAGVPASTAAGSNLNLSVETTNLVSFPWLK